MRLPVPQIVEGAVDAASNKRAKADDIPSLLGTYFAKLILSAHKHCLNETEPWWEAKNDVVVRDFAADLPTDPVRAAAYTTATVLLRMVPDDASPKDRYFSFYTSELASELFYASTLSSGLASGPVSYTHLTLPTIYSV